MSSQTSRAVKYYNNQIEKKHTPTQQQTTAEEKHIQAKICCFDLENDTSQFPGLYVSAQEERKGKKINFFYMEFPEK